jgi:hypothetical protein
LTAPAGTTGAAIGVEGTSGDPQIGRGADERGEERERERQKGVRIQKESSREGRRSVGELKRGRSRER